MCYGYNIPEKEVSVMFLDNDKDKEDTQRIKNLLLFKFWGTNHERDELFSSPWFWGLIIIVFILLTLLTR